MYLLGNKFYFMLSYLSILLARCFCFQFIERFFELNQKCLSVCPYVYPCYFGLNEQVALDELDIQWEIVTQDWTAL